MKKPIRLQYRRTKGFKLVSPNGLPNVCVDRRSKWGNPFRNGAVWFIDGIRTVITPDNHLLCFKNYAKKRKLEAQRWLRGKNLVCRCKAGNPCHADIWLEIANR